MANLKSSIKAARQNKKRTEINRTRKTRIKNIVKKTEEAIASKDKKVALEALRTAQSEIMKAVGKGIIKLNAASRKVSRLTAKVKALGA